MFKGVQLDTKKDTLFVVSFLNENSPLASTVNRWQYFWWAWFTVIFIVMYLITVRSVMYRKMQLDPTMNTSLKSHGKWGDVLVGLIPIFWCFNILLTSSSIQKVIDWETEESLVVLRVRAKQWYWVYKFDLTNETVFHNYQKVVGSGKVQQYHQPTDLRDRFEATDNFTSGRLNTEILENDANVYFSPENHLTKNTRPDWVSKFMVKPHDSVFPVRTAPLAETHSSVFLQHSASYKKTLLPLPGRYNVTPRPDLQGYEDKAVKGFLQPSESLYKESIDLQFNHKSPCRFSGPVTVNKKYYDKNPVLFSFTVQENLDTVASHSSQQKMYERSWGTISQKPLKHWQPVNIKGAENLFTGQSKPTTLFNEGFSWISSSVSETGAVAANRLLNVDSLIVLPTKSPITVITNSFDVVHSWFVPGLGVKLDCVPGRSTHHRLYIDEPGIYYGQCAEICGRFHHHMPIKIAAIDDEHFLLWWADLRQEMNSNE